VVLRADRHARAGRWLEWKVRIFTVAAILGLAGLYLEDRRFTGGAIVLLLGAALLRLIPGAEGEDRSEEHDPEGGDA
jgi:hypothetical protein